MGKQYPQYIDSNPINDDNLANSPHKSVAIALSQVIQNKTYNLKNKVIGLEGEWGSGKSNVIGMLDKELYGTKNPSKAEEIKNHYIYTYDVWAHQEDITRRSFLEEIIAELREHQVLNNSTGFWEDTLNNLTAKKRNINTKRFPEIKSYILFFSLIPISFAILNFLKEFPYFISTDWVWWPKLILGLVFTLLGIRSLIKSYNESKNEIRYHSKEKNEGIIKKEAIARLFYIFNGTELSSEQKESIIEDDPSVTRFKDIFKIIVEQLKCDTLIIVFDNMDRLASKEKLMSVWSSVFTFFSGKPEGKFAKNIWTIIPYDKKHLTALFDVTVPENCVCNTNGGNNTQSDEESRRKRVEDEIINEFLNKTFSTSFRVPTPVVSTWKEYLNELIKEAFGKLIDEEETKVLTSLFKYSTDVTRIKPRELINYVNNLVSLFIQHKDKKISIEYIGFFSLKKDLIVENPVKAILDPDYCFKNEKHLFENQEELSSAMAALFYNLEKDKASEVLLKVNIEKSIYDKSYFDTLTKSLKFADYIEEVIQDEGFDINSYSQKNIAEFFFGVKEYLSKRGYAKCWIMFNETITSAKAYLMLEDWQKNILHNAPAKTATKLAETILQTSFDQNPKNYCDSIIEMFELKMQNVDFSFKVTERSIKQDDFVYLYKNLKDRNLLEELFDKLKISVSLQYLGEFLMDSANQTYDVSKTVNREIVEFLVQKGYDFVALQNKNLEILNTLTYQTDAQIIDQVLILNRILNKKVTTVPTDILNIYGQKKYSESESDVKACILKSLVDNPAQKPNYASFLQEPDSDLKLTAIIESYISYSDLLKLAVEQGFDEPLIVSLIKNLTKQPYDRSELVDIQWVLKNLSKLKDVVFSGPDEIFILIDSLDSWGVHFSEAINSKALFDIDAIWYQLISNDPTHNHFFQKHPPLIAMVNAANLNYQKLSVDEWVKGFGINSNLWNSFKQLLNQNLISKPVFSADNFINAFETYIETFIISNIPSFPSTEMLIIADQMPKARIKTLANALYLSSVGVHAITDIQFDFLVEFFIKHSSIFKETNKAEEVVLKYIRNIGSHKPLLERLLSSNFNDLVQIINNCPEDKADLSSMFNRIVSENGHPTHIKNALEKLMQETQLTSPNSL